LAWAQDEEGGGGGGGRGRGRGGNEPPAKVADTVAPDIPNVVAGGTKVTLVKDGFQNAQGAVAAPDGSLLFTERSANRIMKLDKDGNVTSYMEATGQANGITFDSKGRLIAVQFEPAAFPCSPDEARSRKNRWAPLDVKDLIGDKKGVLHRYLGYSRRVGTASTLKPDGRDHQDHRRHPRPGKSNASPDERDPADRSRSEHLLTVTLPDGSARNGGILEIFGDGPAQSADGAVVDRREALRRYVSGVIVAGPGRESSGPYRRAAIGEPSSLPDPTEDAGR
jgi:hypothetical protein